MDLVGLNTSVRAGAGIGPGSTLASGPKLLPQHRRQATEAMIQYALEPRGVSGGGVGGGSVGCTSSLCTGAPLSVLRDVIVKTINPRWQLVANYYSMTIA